MGYDTNERGSGIAVVVVVVLLLGFFVFLCLGIGAVMYVSRTPSNSATPFMGRATFPGGTIPGYPAVLEGSESAYILVEPVLYLNSDGEIDLNGEDVPVDLVGERVDQEALRHRDEGLMLRVTVAADCPAEALLNVLRQIRDSEYCYYELSAVVVVALEEETSEEEALEEEATKEEAEEGKAGEEDAAEEETADQKTSEEVDPKSTDDTSED
jgi:hypothetical protein